MFNDNKIGMFVDKEIRIESKNFYACVDNKKVFWSTNL